MEAEAAQHNSRLNHLQPNRKKARSAGSPRQSRLHNPRSFTSAEFSLEDPDDGSSHFDSLLHPHTCCGVQSSSGNCTTGRIKFDSGDDLQNAIDRDRTLKLLALDIIDREISEWQHVCITGRPSWWSPVSGNHRRAQSNDVQQSDMFWDMQELRGSADSHSENRRRTSLSDSFLSGKIPLEELAHLIALQLLSACFTLPPDDITGPIPSNFVYWDSAMPSDLPDPHLISSLRMHTHFRYTPSFGHDARNTSPAHPWPHSYDGSSPLDSLTNRVIRSDGVRADSDSKLPDKSSSYARNFKRRRHNLHRALYVTEESLGSDSIDNLASQFQSQSARSNEPPPSPSSTVRNQEEAPDRQENPTSPTSLNRDPNSSQSTALETRNQTSQDVKLPNSPNLTQISPGPNSTSRNLRFVNPKTPLPSRTVSPYHNVGRRKSRRTLKAIIRSDPHPVFVQPVKELVIRRWRSLRRRFWQPTGISESDIPHELRRMPSPKGPMALHRRVRSSGDNSPLLSYKGRQRRNRARQRGHIRSESWESSPRHTTPVLSGVISPEVGSEMGFTSDDAEGFLSPSAVSEAWLSRDETPVYPSPISPDQELSDGILRLDEPLNSDQDALSSTQTNHERYEIKRSGRRSKSRMSEIVTPDITPAADSNSNVLNPTGNPVQNPTMMPTVISLNVLPASSDNLPFEPTLFPEIAALAPRSAENTNTELAMQEKDLEERPPCLHRTSTSGTQVWKPAAEGIEVDGLPVGPAMHEKTWEGRREGSFL